ncbi:MAG: hypothetical protein Fur0012_10250 [Elusimicrobiota bacterium]
MRTKKINKVNTASCCSSGCCCGKKDEFSEKAVKCPICGKKGVSVKFDTVESIIKKNKKVTLKESFYLCENSDCDVLYFSDNSIFDVENSEVDIDFKKGAKTRYACYCNKLTYEEVKEIVKKHKKTDWTFIVKEAKGKIVKSDCIHKNPYGVCCASNSFKKAVEKAGLKF